MDARFDTDRPTEQRPLAGMALRLLTAVLLSVMFALVKLVADRGVHVVESLFWRQVGSALCATAFVALGPGFASLRTKRVGAHLARMGLGVTTMALNFLTMAMLPLAEATAIFNSVPIFSTLLAALWLGEKTGKWRWSAVLVGFAGVLLVARPGGGGLPVDGVAVSLVAALMTAWVTIHIRRLGATEAASTTVFWFAVSSLVPLGLLMIPFGQMHDPTTLAMLAGIALTGGLAQLTLTGALRIAPVALVMPMDYTSLVWAALLGLLIFGDWPHTATWIGGVVIIGSGLTILWREQLLARRAAAARALSADGCHATLAFMKRPQKPRLPSAADILKFIETSDQPAGKREIARAFGLKGNDKIALKALLKDMADEGLIDSAPGRAFHKMGGVPKVTVLRITSTEDGQVLATPEQWHAETPPPRLRVLERKGGKGRSALGVGDRILARTEEAGSGHVAHVMKKLERSAELVLGVVKKSGERFFLTPVDKRERREWPISDLKDAQPGDLVLAEPTGRPPRQTVRIDAILGDPFAPRSFSLIAIHKHGLRDTFKEEAIAEAKKVAEQKLGDREDLTHLPIVAIDPEDARDHDDAIWARRREDGDGWDAIVAIADVSFYVRPGSELDREARARGNSVYFPDRVVPMLPHELSSDICSLKEGEPRAALACHLHVGKDGGLKAWRFSRAKIRVAANIAYEDAQAAYDAATADRIEVASSPCAMPEVEGPVPAELVEGALLPLWECWSALLKAREKREPLELDLPERRVVLDEKGRIMSVAPRERLDAHRLVEDYMIAANVAAAKALEKKKAPVMYRVHDGPGREKLVTLKDYLATFDLEFALGQVVKPSTFNRIIERIGPDHPGRTEIMEQLLRTQMQARYAPDPLGHFGLSLASYAHFTSPIRRYADLLVHRALVSAYRLGDGGLPAEDATRFAEIGEAISMLERRAMEAERETIDRYVAAYLSDKVGQLLKCRITGVQPFGFFATVETLGGDGLVLASTLGNEYFRYDEKSQSLIGEQSGETYSPGQKLELKLAEANPASGALRFELPEGKFAGPPRDRRDRTRKVTTQRRGRPANIRHQGRKR